MFRSALLLSASLSLLAQNSTVITHEKVWLTKRVSNPIPSPDGRFAIVSVTEPAYDPAQQVSDLWLIPVEPPAAPRRLTHTKGAESGVAWSPDSRHIAFSARREGDDAPQIYILPLAGGEAWRLTRLATGARSPIWRPDGKALAFQSDVYPGARTEEDNAKAHAERKARKYNARAWDAFPIARWDTWVSNSHPHLFVQALDPNAKPLNLLASSRLVSLPGFAGNDTGDGGEDLEPAWFPDGAGLVFTATTNRHTVTYALPTTHLYAVLATGGEPQPLTSGDDSFEAARFAPDGKNLYATFSRSGVKALYSLNRIAQFPWPVNAVTPRLLAPSFDFPINRFRIAPDSRTLYLIVEQTGREKVFSLPATGDAAPQPLSTAPGGVFAGLEVAGAPAAPVLLATWMSMIQPPEVVRIDPRSGAHSFLTSFTQPDIANLDWQPPREFWVNSKTGRRIHNFLVLPPNFDPSRKYPLLVFMHGGPHQAWKDQWFLRWNYHLLASPGYVVLMTNYTGSPGYGERFAAAINHDVLRGPATEINDSADEAIRLFPFIDASRQAAGGASYGGYLANWMQGNTTRYKCLFTHAGLTNNESMWGTTDGGYYWELRYGGPVWEAKGQWQDQNPLRYAARFQTPMLITHGSLDLRVPLGQGIEMFKLLQRRQVPSRLIIFPEENHWILNGENARYFFDELFAWLKKYL